MHDDAPRSELIPAGARSPLALVAVWLVPQVLLLLLNARSFWLVVGEMSRLQAQQFGALLAIEVLLLATGAAYAWMLRARRAFVSVPAAVAIVLIHIAYLWYFTASIFDLLPDSVTVWILPPDIVLFHQYTFMMPALFFGALRVACFPMSAARRVDTARTLLAAIGIPILFYMLFHVIGLFYWRALDRLPGEVIFVFFLAFTVIMVIGLLRLTALLYHFVAARNERGMAITAAVVGLVGPIAGLLLNRKIPFPVDFQSAGVYAMAVLNGLVLTLPRTRSVAINRAAWLARCALFPFTLYFFLVFLPFLPLSILAIIAMGAGFLMLVPTVLFAIHGYRIVGGYCDARTTISKPAALAMMLAALAIIPVGLTANAWMDRTALRAAIDYVYTSRADQGAFTGHRAFLKHALVKMNDRRCGIELPYLSGYYDWIVFNNLTLPEEKQKCLYRVFFGGELDEPKALLADFFGRSRTRGWSSHRTGTPPPVSATLAGVSAETRADQACEKTIVTLTMTNDDTRLAEFATTIAVPDGVFVSGFWLHMNGERVPGQIFEKKTAMWVYQMIRDSTRRDPGLLTYGKDGSLDLRVYPFKEHETRTVELEFTHPTGLAPHITVGDRDVQLGSLSAAPRSVDARVQGRGRHIVIPESIQRQLPRVHRRPLLYFILDRSATCASTVAEQLRRVGDIARGIDPSAPVMIAAANFNCRQFTANPVQQKDLVGIDTEELPAEGGLFLARAVQNALMDYRARSSGAPDSAKWAQYVPRIVVLQGDATVPAEFSRLGSVSRYAPDVSGFEIQKTRGDVERRHWDGSSGASLDQDDVILFRAGNQFIAVPAKPGIASVWLPDTGGTEAFEVFDPATDGYTLLPCATADETSCYGAATKAWMQYLDSVLLGDPGKTELAEQVGLSRTTGILLPSTAYIVVENSAQWKMLQLKERQKLDAPAALAFKDTPEPETWALLAIAGALVLGGRVLRKRRLAYVALSAHG